MGISTLKPIKINFAGGAGGHWLWHIIYCLENNIFDETNKPSNFHSRQLSQNVDVSHFHSEYDLLLSSKYKFNIWLNSVLKNKVYHIPNDWYKNAHTYVAQSGYYTKHEWEDFYGKNIDIDISWTSTNPTRLINKIYLILDEHNIPYTKNNDLVLLKIKEFINSCPNPFKYIGNLNDKHWQVWCLGLLGMNKVPSSYDNVKQAKEQIYKNHNYFVEKTKQWSYKL